MHMGMLICHLYSWTFRTQWVLNNSFDPSVEFVIINMLPLLILAFPELL